MCTCLHKQMHSIIHTGIKTSYQPCFHLKIQHLWNYKAKKRRNSNNPFRQSETEEIVQKIASELCNNRFVIWKKQFLQESVLCSHYLYSIFKDLHSHELIPLLQTFYQSFKSESHSQFFPYNNFFPLSRAYFDLIISRLLGIYCSPLSSGSSLEIFDIFRFQFLNNTKSLERFAYSLFMFSSCLDNSHER